MSGRTDPGIRAALLLLLVACGDPPTPSPVPTTVSVSPETAAFAALGETVQFTAVVHDQFGNVMSGAAVEWATRDPAAVSVSESGLATALANGTTTVSATVDGVSGSAAVTVAQVVSVLIVTPDSLLFSSLGDTARLEAVALDAGGSAVEGAAVMWSSSDSAVAAANSEGLVAAVANGTTTVSATVDGVSGSAAVTVAQVASVLNVTPALLLLPSLGDSARLEAVALDAGGSAVEGAVFTWSSSDESVASVDERGLVRALSPGTTVITAAHGAATGAAAIVVSRPPPLTDRDALEALYRAAGGADWTKADGWLSDAPLRQWHGIETDDSGSVTAVRLPENGLAGGIPPELGHLPYLETLNLRKNNLTGTLPAEIGLAIRLRELDLGHIELEGPIPATLGRLVDLRRLNFEYVPFSGPIPPELGALEELEFLNLYRNRLTGPLPPELAGLRKLRTFYVDENGLTGSVPSAFADLSELRVFYWGYNDGLCAPGTPDFETWRGEGRDAQGPRCNEADVAALEHLYHRTGGADWTNSTGWLESAAVELWHGVGADSLGRVTLLDLSGNEVRGRLPGAVGELGRLSVLRVGDNPLSGPLPQSLDALALEEFRYGDTEVCVPRSRHFRRWLDAIPIREGTDEPCAPLSEREVLEAVYDATRGAQWWRRDGWLTDAPLEDWHGVKTDDDGRVVELALYGNNLRGRAPAELGQLDRLRLLDLSYNWLRGPIPLDLTDIETLEEIYLESNLLDGPIPSELGALTGLASLYLWDNRLEGSIPPELGNLSALEDLRISYNRLTGRIPPEIGNLSRVVVIWMDFNELEGEIPPELGNLSSIQTFYLGYNKLTGEIPPELANLPSVRALALDYNDLTGPIPVELGNLTTLDGELNLIGNRLSGSIPVELSRLDAVPALRLGHNNLSGELPPELGRMDALEWLDVSHNPGLAGPLPSTFAYMPKLGRFEGVGTGLCVDAESPLANPVVFRRFRMPFCDPPPERSSAYLVQSVQSALYPVPLVAGEDALLRVFPISPKSTDTPIPPARASFFVGGTEVYAADAPGQSTPIPTELAQAEASLDRSANVRIPASVVRPGLEMVVEIDPEGTLDPDLGVALRIPESGRLPVPVEAMPTLELTMVPFIWREKPDSTAVDLAVQMAEDPEGHGLLWDTRTLLPVGDLSVTAHAPVMTTSNNSDELLDETTAIRTIEGGTGYYMGALSGEATGSWGVAWIDGWTSYVRLGNVDEPSEALTIAHELGHNMSLYHAPCDVRSVVDQAYPYPDGSTGTWGLDVRSGSDVLVPATRADLMSYCIPAWVGEYHFYRAMHHRLVRERPGDLSRASGSALLVWGGVSREGVPYLNPALAVDAPAALPHGGGQYEIAGRTADGDALFAFSFDMETAADLEERAGFAFAIPSSPDWLDALAEIELRGPAGSATLDDATNRPVLILRDRATGGVRAILRGGPAAAAVAEIAAGASVLPTGPNPEVLYSRGLPRPVTRPTRR